MRMNETIQDDSMIRPLGRLSLFLKAKIIQKILENFLHEIRLIWKQANEQVNFFIVSSMSDGLGSGTVMDLATIAQAASNVEKVKVGIIGILIAELSGSHPKTTPLKEVNLYALLMEISYFQNRQNTYKFLMPDKPTSQRNGKIFNLCYLSNLTNNFQKLNEDTRQELAISLELISLSPQDSASRLMLDQVESSETNFAAFGCGVLQCNLNDVISFCTDKLSAELLKNILENDAELEFKNRTLSGEIENCTPENLKGVFFRFKEANKNQCLPKVGWKKIKNADASNLHQLKDEIVKNHFGSIAERLNNYLEEVKEKLFSQIEEEFSQTFLKKISTVLASFNNEASRIAKQLALNENETSRDFRQLVSNIKEISEASALKQLLGLFNKEWKRRKVELAENFSSILQQEAELNLNRQLWETILNFYNDIQAFVKVVDQKAGEVKKSMDGLLSDIEKETEEKTQQLSVEDALIQPLFTKDNLVEIYEKYKPNLQKPLEHLYQDNPNFWAFVDENNLCKLQEYLTSISSTYFIGLNAMDISGCVKPGGIMPLGKILKRLYLISRPEFEYEAPNGDEFYERIIVKSDIDTQHFEAVKENLDFDIEVIYDDCAGDKISMLREWYGIQLAKMPLIKSMEKSYIELRKEDFPLHNVEARPELPLIGYSPDTFEKKKTTFLVGQALKIIIVRNGNYLWIDSNGDEIELALGKEKAFLAFLEREEISLKIEKQISELLIDNGEKIFKNAMRTVSREKSFQSLFNEKETETLGKFYRETILK